MGECFKAQSEEEGEETCISFVLGGMSNEVKSLKYEVITLKDEIVKMMAAKNRELGKQVVGRMKNASMQRTTETSQGRMRLAAVK